MENEKEKETDHAILTSELTDFHTATTNAMSIFLMYAGNTATHTYIFGHGHRALRQATLLNDHRVQLQFEVCALDDLLLDRVLDNQAKHVDLREWGEREEEI